MTHPAHGAILTLHRPMEITYAARAYKIYIDGVKVDTVGVNGTVDIPIAPGQHRVKAKIDWCSSPEVIIEVAPGQRVFLDVRSAGAAHEKLVNQLFRPGQFLAVSPIHA